jgi:class 3 adenylate cyclase/tetratricopeptide (TPR) repeat protein
MKCPNCDTENPITNKFCRECGSKLTIKCPGCKAEIHSGDKFCGECGEKLVAISKASEAPTYGVEGERKHVTVLFSDLSGFSAMSEALDPEEVKEIMSRIFGEIAQVVTKYEGFIEKFVGDAVMAIFGVPKTHEDDPVRAIKAAIEIHNLVKDISPKLEQKVGQPLNMHSGINTGLIVTSEVDMEKGTHGVVGDTLNLASRLSDIAGPDEILVSPQTRELIFPYFNIKSMGSVNISGKDRSIIPHLVLGELDIQTRFEASERKGLTAFTGRGQELATLHSCLDKITSGKGQFVTVVGEAGVGKSRLIYEFRHSIDRSKITVLEGRCQTYGSDTPYFPLLNALRRGLRLREEDTPKMLLEKAVANILTIDQTLEQYLPLYLHLLAIPSEDHPLPKNLMGQDLKSAFQDALAAINILNSKRQPMVLILEDWHWVDEASDSALRHIVSLIAPHSLMVVIIYRPEYTASWGNWSYHTPVVLRPMDSQHTEDILKSVWAADRIPQGLTGLIHERTGGNPLFIEEVCNVLTDESTVQVKDKDAILTNSLNHITLPDTVQAVIRARFDRLDKYARDSLRLASVIGREFARRLLERVSTARDQLPESIETLKALELIQQVQVVPETAYMFKHVLTQEVTYETLLHQKRKELHRLVGQAIEELYQDRIEEQVDLLHHHFSLAENWSKAAKYGRQAANRAYRLSQFDQSLITFERAKECLLKLPEDRFQKETLINLLFEMIWPLHFLGQGDRIIQICKEVESMAQSLESPLLLGRVYAEYGLSHFFENRLEKAEEYYLKAIKKLEGNADESLILGVRFTLAVSYFSRAQWEAAATLYSEIIQVKDIEGTQAEYSGEQPYLPYTHCCTHLGYIRALQGRIEEAKNLLKKGHTPSLEQASNLQSRLWCALWHSAAAILIGEDIGALDRIEAVLIIAEKTDSPLLYFLGCAAKGNALAANEQFDTARESYEKGLEAIENTTHRRYLEAVYYNLVQINLDFGDWTAANRYYQAGLPLIQLNPERETPRYDFLKGRLMAVGNQRDFKQAEFLLEKSAKADEQLGSLVLAAQTRFYLSQLLVKKGEKERGRFLLNEIHNKFKDWGIVFWQKKCKQAIEGLKIE